MGSVTSAQKWRRRLPTPRVLGGIVLAAIVLVGVAVCSRLFLLHTSTGATFLADHPGETALPSWAPVGQPAWTQWQHYLNAFFMVLIVKTGWTVRTQAKPSAMWQRRSGTGKKIAVELWMHLALDLLWLVNGAAFLVLLFTTGAWVRVVPTSWDVFPNALSAALQYASFDWPVNHGWVNYNSLQVLTYFTTIFLAAPLAAVSGFRMSLFWPSGAKRVSLWYPRELAEKLHFPVMLYFCGFVVVHVTLVLATGARRNLNHMFWGSDDPVSWAGLGVCALGIAAIATAVCASRPFVIQQLGAVFGKVGR